MRIRRFICLLLLLGGLACPGQTYPLKICSFNIQFLGNSRKRDDAALARLLQHEDIVVVQELVAPPFPGTFPDGTPFVPAPKAREFFEQMTNHGFAYVLSEEDTGPGSRIHKNGSATEWWAVFYKPRSVSPAPDLPRGFLAETRAGHPDYDRVPYAFAFRTVDARVDFVLVSVHLRPGSGRLNKVRRKQELGSIAAWIEHQSQTEKDFFILGDMNLENLQELQEGAPTGFRSLNAGCVPTNTNVKSRKPYDHVMFREQFTWREIDQDYGFRVIDLIEAMREPWRLNYSGRYPGDPPYDHNQFRAVYSDHHPVRFRIRPAGDTDDD